MISCRTVPKATCACFCCVGVLVASTTTTRNVTTLSTITGVHVHGLLVWHVFCHVPPILGNSCPYIVGPHSALKPRALHSPRLLPCFLIAVPPCPGMVGFMRAIEPRVAHFTIQRRRSGVIGLVLCGHIIIIIFSKLPIVLIFFEIVRWCMMIILTVSAHNPYASSRIGIFQRLGRILCKSGALLIRVLLLFNTASGRHFRMKHFPCRLPPSHQLGARLPQCAHPLIRFSVLSEAQMVSNGTSPMSDK